MARQSQPWAAGLAQQVATVIQPLYEQERQPGGPGRARVA